MRERVSGHCLAASGRAKQKKSLAWAKSMFPQFAKLLLLLDDALEPAAKFRGKHQLSETHRRLDHFKQSGQFSLRPGKAYRIGLLGLRRKRDRPRGFCYELLNLLGQVVVSLARLARSNLQGSSAKSLVVTVNVTSKEFQNLPCRRHVLLSDRELFKSAV